MSPADWALRPLKRYADFRGRAPRAEYWWYVLATAIVGTGLRFIDIKLNHPIVGNHGPLGLTFAAVLLIPGLAVVVRRMHDSGRTGWWCMMSVSGYIFSYGVRPLGLWHLQSLSTLESLAAIGGMALWCSLAIIFFILLLAQGDKGSNRYGPDPYGRTDLEEVFA